MELLSLQNGSNVDWMQCGYWWQADSRMSVYNPFLM